MNWNHPATLAVGAFLFVLVLTSAFWVVTLRNMFRAALSLGLVLLGVAGLFILLEAEFLAFVQILVYVGAILTLVVFAIMLTARLNLEPERPSGDPFMAAVVSGLLFVLLAVVGLRVAWPSIPASTVTSAAQIGQQFITTLVLPFELVSLVFVAALVGAIAITTRRDAHGKRPS